MALQEWPSPPLSAASSAASGSAATASPASDRGTSDASGNRKKQRVFKSIGPIFVPVEAVYGGHLLAQSAYAAYKTIGKEFYCHSVSGHFLVSGKKKLGFLYTVDTLRQGKSYGTRYVQVRQPTPEQWQKDPFESDVIFVATVSFKTVERPSLDSQVPPPKELRNWLENPRQREKAPAVDIPSWREYAKHKGIPPPYLAVDFRSVNTAEENRGRPPHERRTVQLYTPISTIPADEHLTLSICAHIYASDRDGLFSVTTPYGASDHIIHTGTLSHKIVLHADPMKMLFKKNHDNHESDDPSDWFALEQFGDGVNDGRGLHRGRIWNSDGTLIATILQDALIRLRLPEPGFVETDMRKMTFLEKVKSSL